MTNATLNKNRNAWIMALLATLAYSTSSPIARYLFIGGMSPTAMLVSRYLLATLLLAVTLRLAWREQLKIDRRGLAICLLAGAVNGFSTLAYFWGLSRMSASISAMIFTLYPLAVLGFLALRGERFSMRSGVRLLLGMAGVYLLVVPGGQIDTLGVLLVLLAATTFALSLAIVQWYLPGYSSMTVSFYTTITISAVAALFWLAQGAPWYVPGWQGWLALIFMTVVGTYLARLAMFKAVQGFGSFQMALFAPLETLLTISWSMLFLEERLTLTQWLGGGLIILSMLLAFSFAPLRAKHLATRSH
jgi:drug/metabolite transporter (DMT)-like permease